MTYLYTTRNAIILPKPRLVVQTFPSLGDISVPVARRRAPSPEQQVDGYLDRASCGLCCAQMVAKVRSMC